MGNQLVGIAPSQIFPVEHYLTEHPDLQFDVNLGSTRFLKVARGKSQEGLIVVKVFAIHDPSLPLAAYKERLEEVRNELASAVNCLPFQRILLTDRAGFLMREYVKYSLYDRISTRPFLTNIEKRWIAFQVLYSLHQCHKVGVCHGDIKLENILITSWNWVLLADFASFKPTYLPEDNPADFSYFFDTSRRRTCYIAPERFIKTLSTDVSSHLLLPEETMQKGDLTPAMDIFSAGCALAELFSEGHDAPFDFSQLLAYRAEEYTASHHLDKLEDPHIRELIKDMLQRDPSKRKSAELYLAQEKGRVFPEYFYSFLQSYMLIFSAAPILSPDEKITRLKKDIQNIIKILNPEEEEENKVSDKKTEKGCEGEKSVNDKSGAEGLVIITSLVTSCIRGLHHCTSKLQCLDMLLELAAHTSSETILDRILPYIIHLIHDPFPRVRLRAIHTLTNCLALVKNIPCSDANIFPEYILPSLAGVASDDAVIVRAAYAENIACLAETALRFLEQCQMAVAQQGGGGGGDAIRPSYETELQTLHEMIQQAVAMLLTDPCNLVKQTLMENGITKLCVFFGKQKANDVLLSHMITFLNDKDDKQLRGSFFDCIVGVAAYVGWHSSPILTPLLQQGLTDLEEFVVVKAINAMRSLTELGLLQKSSLYELLRDATCFLVHPNLWIRHVTVGFLSAMARTLDLVDVQCKVMVVIQPYLRHQLIQADKEVLLLNALMRPIPRVVYDSVVKCPDIDGLLATLEERQRARGLVKAGHIPQNMDLQPNLKNLFRRLSSEGMTDVVEDQLLAMSRHLRKIHRHRCGSETKLTSSRGSDGKIDLGSLRNPVPCHAIPLPVSSGGGAGKSENMVAGTQARKSQRVRKIQIPPESHLTTMNEEWQHMFGGTPEPHSPLMQQRLSDTGSISPPGGGSMVSEVHSSPQHSFETDHASLHERSYIQYRCAPCRLELRDLIVRKQEQYAVAVRSREWAEQAAWRPPLPPPNWRLRGSLVAHLHEHKGAITRLIGIPDTPLFASSSSDGCIRVWDCGKMEGRNIANRSRQVYNRQAGALVGLTVCENNQSLASASHSGSVFVLRIEANSNKMSVVQSRQLDLQEDGCAVDIHYFDSGAQSVLVYATMYGSIVGWDLRAPGTAWKLDNDLKRGVITSFCLDPHQRWLAVGTGSGYHICWDLRFQLPISTIDHPNRRVSKVNFPPLPTGNNWVSMVFHGADGDASRKNMFKEVYKQIGLLLFLLGPFQAAGARIRKLICHPTEPSCIISAVQNNNEVTVWNLETHFRQTVLWASVAPPLTYNPGNSHSVCAMYGSSIDRSPFLLTGGTDMRLRYWDLDSPSDSFLAIPAANDTLNPTSVTYMPRIIDGINVVHEAPVKPRTIPGGTVPIQRVEDPPRPGPDQPQAGHHDWISEVAMCQASQCFLLTGSRDGVIKLWK